VETRLVWAIIHVCISTFLNEISRERKCTYTHVNISASDFVCLDAWVHADQSSPYARMIFKKRVKMNPRKQITHSRCSSFCTHIHNICTHTHPTKDWNPETKSRTLLVPLLVHTYTQSHPTKKWKPESNHPILLFPFLWVIPTHIHTHTHTHSIQQQVVQANQEDQDQARTSRPGWYARKARS
jgi:hypothetical protein